MGACPARAPPLGIIQDSQFVNQTFALDGGCLYLYTDGLLEARVGNLRLEQEGLLRLFKEYSHLPLAARPRAIVDAVVDPEGVVEDDLTLVIIEGV